ncbi:MAG: hypothetical protein ACI80V_001113 [Rhodothermales bacterium]|jgi:hypothetical protein
MIRHLDHLVYAAADLQAGIDAIERLTGVRAEPGGRHPSFGTHNALLRLGPAAYLEIMAPDPGLPAPARGRLTDGWRLEFPRLVTWVLRPRDICSASLSAAGLGVELGEINPCSRQTPQGHTLHWKLSDPYCDRLGGAVPFLIDWEETPHPSENLREAVTLTGFRVEHPDSAKVRKLIEALGAKVVCRPKREIRLMATLQTPNGVVELT